tara:strand:- start:2328 stop:2492 length:165 start_codon:yes stop_codon:yes gene_type:complete
MEEEIFEYLDALRKTGETNMFGAGPYLQAEFGVTPKEARKYVVTWFKREQSNQE